MTLRAKLILSFSMVASVPLVGGAIGIYAHRTAVQQTELVRQTARQAVQLVNAVHVLQARIEAARHDRTLAPSALPVAALRENLAEIKSLAVAVALPDELLTAVASSLNAWESSWMKSVGGETDRVAAATRALLAAVLEKTDAAVRVGLQSPPAAHSYLELIMGVGTIFGIALGIGFGVVTSIAVTRHIQDIAGVMWSQTTDVAAAASQVVDTSGSLAQASNQQAASLEETSASLTEVNNIVKTNADHSREAQTLSQENRRASDRSASDVADLQVAMKEMATASGNIAKIIKSIDEIAFQTNILALNAAVEAARAGEAGSGFAVVAEEVRSLAQRSAQAARETAEKIDDALAKSTRGASIAARVEQSLRTVIADTHRVDEIISRIAQASVEQARSLDQAVHSMDRIDQLTQSNTASAGQTADAAQQLDSKIGELRQQLSRLMEVRVEDRPAVSPVPAQRTPAAAPSRGVLVPA